MYWFLNIYKHIIKLVAENYARKFQKRTEKHNAYLEKSISYITIFDASIRSHVGVAPITQLRTCVIKKCTHLKQISYCGNIFFHNERVCT